MKISKEIIANATDYISLKEKYSIVVANAVECIEELNLVGSAPYWKEDVFLKKMILAKVLLSDYLHIVDKNDVLTVEMYDEYMSEDIVGQILDIAKETRKTDVEISGKADKIVKDYTELCKMMSTEIYSVLQAKNNLADRLLADDKFMRTIADTMAVKTAESLGNQISNEITPEAYQNALKEYGETMDKANAIIQKIKEN